MSKKPSFPQVLLISFCVLTIAVLFIGMRLFPQSYGVFTFITMAMYGGICLLLYSLTKKKR